MRHTVSESEIEGSPHASRCGAKTRAGVPCKNGKMPNGRCRMHGGLSRGASLEGRKRISEANWKHGAYSQKHIELRQRLHEIQQGNRAIFGRLQEVARVNPDACRRVGWDPERILRMEGFPPSEDFPVIKDDDDDNDG